MKDSLEKTNIRALSELLMERGKARLVGILVLPNISGVMFRKMNVGRQEVVLGVWDTAGSERYESMARMYYRSAPSNCTIMCHSDVTALK